MVDRKKLLDLIDEFERCATQDGHPLAGTSDAMARRDAKGDVVLAINGIYQEIDGLRSQLPAAWTTEIPKEPGDYYVSYFGFNGWSAPVPITIFVDHYGSYVKGSAQYISQSQTHPTAYTKNNTPPLPPSDWRGE